MARNEQLIRQHKILQLLERYRFGRTLEEIRDELVEELGLGSLHPRSVRRDLEALQAAGIDVDVHENQRGKLWKLGSQARGSFRITASATELIALSLSRDLLYPLAGTPFWIGIESFWSKLREELPEAVWKHYQEYRQALFVRGMPAKSYQKQHGVLSIIHRAIVEHRVVEIEYQPPGKDPQKRRIEPYAVMFHQSSLYIIAAAHEAPAESDRIRHLKLDRFLKATACDEWFKIPEGFNLERHLGEGVGVFSGSKAQNVRIRLTQRGARFVSEDPWRPDQQLEPQADGGAILSIQAVHELEVIPRVLALGGEAEILSPVSYRRSIAQVLKSAAARYGDVEV